MNKPDYIPSLTALRGIAALWVVLFHIDVSLVYRDLGALLPREETGIFSKGYLWVDFFFILSGFIITHVYGSDFKAGLSWGKIKRFLLARFRRVYPLHLFTTLILAFLVLLVGTLLPGLPEGSWGSFFNWAMLPIHLLLLQSFTTYHGLSWNLPSWSISAEWWTYLLGIGFIVLMHQRKIWKPLVVGVCSFVGLLVLVQLHSGTTLDITYDFGVLRCLFEFPLGILVYQLYVKKWGSKILGSDWVLLALTLFIVLHFHLLLFDLLIIAVYCLLILSAAYNRSVAHKILNGRLLTYLGNISYSIYLVHGLWFMVFWFLFTYLSNNPGTSNFLQDPVYRIGYVFLFIGLTILSSHFTYHLIETKLSLWLKAKLKKNKKT